MSIGSHLKISLAPDQTPFLQKSFTRAFELDKDLRKNLHVQDLFQNSKKINYLINSVTLRLRLRPPSSLP